MSDWHVIPVDDCLPHEEIRQCLCRPTITEEDEDGAVVVHHSYDGREYFEPDGPGPVEQPH